MTDAVLSKRVATDTIDFSIGADGGILQDDFFDSLILVALYEERRASPSEIEAPQFRRGWQGNEATPDFERGSKIWLFDQARLTRTVINGIIAAANESLNVLVKRGYAVEVAVDIDVIEGVVNLKIDIRRTDNQIVTRFFPLWENSGITEIKGV